MSARKEEVGQHTDSKSEMKLGFAIDAARPVQAAADAAHELNPTDPDKASFERDMEVAMLANRLPLLCGPMLRVLNDVVHLLIQHEGEHDAAPSEQRPS